ncbi:MAG: molybdopterin-dependent oxidoreductase, partial [Bacillota bacterium]
CINCPAVCPMRVKVQDGRAVHIEGNPLSKVTNGAICAKGLLNLQTLYDPDRIKGPMKRTNPNKGLDQDPKWVPISWDEALETIAKRLNTLRDKGEAHRFLLIRGRYMISDADAVYGNFTKIYGTPNAISHSALCAEGDKMGQWMANGQFKYSAYEIEKSNYLLLFGLSPLEAHRPTARLQNQWGNIRKARGNKCKVVVIDPHMNVSANLADEWVPINVGTDGALALSIAHEILVNGLWDKSYVGDFKAGGSFKTGQTVNEEDFAEKETLGLIKWWNLELKDFTVAKAAEKTGIPADTIKRIAREFATSKPAIAWRARGATAWTNGSYNSFAIFALNALVGSYDRAGGIVVQGGVSMKKPGTSATDEIGKKSAAMPRLDFRKTKLFPNASVVSNQVADSIIEGKPYTIDTAIAWMANWNHSAPGSWRWTEALKKLPFFVHVTPFASEMTLMADIVLPTPTTLEKWAYETSPDAGGIPEVRIKQPVVDRMFDTRQTGQIFFDLAAKMGGFVDQQMKKMGNGIEAYVKATVESVMPWSEWEEKGVFSGSPVKYGDASKQKTPSKKFEFYSGNLKATLEKLKMTDTDLDAIHIRARGDKVYVPHFEEPVFLGDKKEFPLVLASYKLTLNSEGRSANNTWAMESYNPLIGEAYDNPAELNPETAAKLGIADGDRIEVESPFGKLVTRAKVWPGVHPEVVSMPFGLGHKAYGKVAKDKGVNPNDITGVAYDHLSGHSCYFNTRVRVRKV